MIRKLQKGSLLIEMMAIIGLLALVTPILFQQVHRRNEEILSTQVATEMRMIKDGVTAYLEANEDIFAKTRCTGTYVANGVETDSTLWNESAGAYIDIPDADCDFDIKNADDREALEGYIAGVDNAHDQDNGNDNKPGILDYYIIKVFGYTLPTRCDASTNKCEFRPVLYAVIIDDNPSENLRRKAKIASLIGAEGGVVDYGSDQILGVQGSWSMKASDVIEEAEASTHSGEYATAIVTFFNNISSSSVLKDVRWQHLKATTAQADTIAGEKIAARSLLTVGDSDDNCISGYGTNALTVTNAAALNANCKPFFEVDPDTKEVRISSRIRSGVSTTKFRCDKLRHRECRLIQDYDATLCKWNSTSVSCEIGNSSNKSGMVEVSCSGLDKDHCEAVPGCTYSGGNCTSCEDWNGTEYGCRTYARGCAWLVDKNNNNGKCVGEYILDPSEKSIMSDLLITNDLTVRNQQGKEKSLVASLPNQVLVASGIACSYRYGDVLCVDGDYKADDPNNSSVMHVYYRSVIGTRCNSENAGDIQVRVSDDEDADMITVHGAIFNDEICDLMKTAHSAAIDGNEDFVDPCAPTQPTEEVPHPVCSSTRVSCIDYCDKLAAVCNKGSANINVSDLTIVKNCLNIENKDERKACQACNSYASNCKRACTELYPGESITQMTANEIGYVYSIALRSCYLARGTCEIATHYSPNPGDFRYSEEYSCSDPHYGYSLGVAISNLDRDSDANPSADYNNPNWTVHMGGALGVIINEYCVPYPEPGSSVVYTND